MNDRLKLTLLKVSKVAVKVAAVGMVTSGIVAWGVQYLPPDVYQQLTDWMNSSRQVLATYSISSTAVGGGILMGTQALKVVSASMNETDLKIQAIETKLKKEVNKELKVHADLDERVLDNINVLIAETRHQNKQNDIIIAFNVLTAKRNLSLSDDLVPQEQKEQYKKWLKELSTINHDIKPITKVLEVKEVIEKKVEVSNGKVRSTW